MRFFYFILLACFFSCTAQSDQIRMMRFSQDTQEDNCAQDDIERINDLDSEKPTYTYKTGPKTTFHTYVLTPRQGLIKAVQDRNARLAEKALSSSSILLTPCIIKRILADYRKNARSTFFSFTKITEATFIGMWLAPLPWCATITALAFLRGDKTADHFIKTKYSAALYMVSTLIIGAVYAKFACIAPDIKKFRDITGHLQKAGFTNHLTPQQLDDWQQAVNYVEQHWLLKYCH